MLQQDKPDDYVVATGRQESVRTFVELTAKELNWTNKNTNKSIIWEGSGIQEVGRRADNGDIVIRIDKKYYRPSEVDNLLGNPEKAKIKLGWEPKISLSEGIKNTIEWFLKEQQK